MGSAIASIPTEGGWSLRARILAVNLFAVLMLAGGILYLDGYRARLIDQRRVDVRHQAELIATALADDGPARLAAVDRFGAVTGARLRLYGPPAAPALLADSWGEGESTFTLRDPGAEPARRRVARWLDRAIDTVAGAPTPPEFPEAWPQTAAAWPEIGEARLGVAADRLWRAPDRTSVLGAAAVVPGTGERLHIVANARDITFAVRDERWRSFQLFLGVLAATLALSTFLARTIATPLSQLAHAAGQVRRGRAREVVVPRLPQRRDEIGQLARALSDMTAALRQRIDATEAFAADVAHELKNPLASLRSAVETLPKVDDPELRRELQGVMADDVGRLDRLLTAIADASRLDAEMSRARFVPVNLAAIARDIAQLTPAPPGVTVMPPGDGPHVLGDPDRLGQVVRNLLDNAYGFSPTGGTVTMAFAAEGTRMAVLTVEDDGPGIPPESLERVFERFYSARPDEAFGQHSGLGLAIARAIVEAHGGEIFAENRDRGGARFTVRLPRA